MDYEYEYIYYYYDEDDGAKTTGEAMASDSPDAPSMTSVSVNSQGLRYSDFPQLKYSTFQKIRTTAESIENRLIPNENINETTNSDNNHKARIEERLPTETHFPPRYHSILHF